MTEDQIDPDRIATFWASSRTRRLLDFWPIVCWLLLAVLPVIRAVKTGVGWWLLGSMPFFALAFTAWRLARPGFVRFSLRADGVLVITDFLAPRNSLELRETRFRSPLVGHRHQLRMPATIEIEGVDPRTAHATRIVVTGTDRPGRNWPSFFTVAEAMVLQLFAEAQALGMALDEPSRTIPRETFEEDWQRHSGGWYSQRRCVTHVVQLLPNLATIILALIGFYRGLMLLAKTVS